MNRMKLENRISRRNQPHAPHLVRRRHTVQPNPHNGCPRPFSPTCQPYVVRSGLRRESRHEYEPYQTPSFVNCLNSVDSFIFIIAALQVPAYAMHDRNARWSVSHLHCVLSGCFSDLPDFAGSCHNGVLWQRRNTLRRPENLGNPQKKRNMSVAREATSCRISEAKTPPSK